MIRQIAFGDPSLVDQLLCSALEDLKTHAAALKSADLNNNRSLFAILHKLKTTLGMLQSSEAINGCQQLLTQVEKAEMPLNPQQLDTFADILELVIKELNTTVEQI